MNKGIEAKYEGMRAKHAQTFTGDEINITGFHTEGHSYLEEFTFVHLEKKDDIDEFICLQAERYTSMSLPHTIKERKAPN